MRSALLRPYTCYLDPTTPVPHRTRIIAIILMWLAVLSSASLFIVRDASAVIPISLVLAAILGTLAILRWRRNRLGLQSS